MGLMTELGEACDNPIELIEEIVLAHDWPFDRVDEEELSVTISGLWTSYHLRFSWCPDYQALQILCGFDMRVPDGKCRTAYELIGLINEQIWLGHFDFWKKENVPMFRHGVLLRGVGGATAGQCEDLIDIAVSACDRFYPAFQLMVWGGKSPTDSIAAIMLEPQGEA